MFKIFNGNGIQISRGDYALIPIRVTGAEDGEDIVFSISKELNPETPLIEKTAEIADGIAYFPLAASETAGLECGKYLWDCVLRDFWGEGKPHTPQSPKPLWIVGVSHSV